MSKFDRQYKIRKYFKKFPPAYSTKTFKDVSVAFNVVLLEVVLNYG